MGVEVAPPPAADKPAAGDEAAAATAAAGSSAASGGGGGGEPAPQSQPQPQQQQGLAEPPSGFDAGSRQQQLAEGAQGAAATAVPEPLIVVDVGDLKELVGQPPYPTDKIYADGTPTGVVG